MSGALNTLRRAVAEQLRETGLSAVSAMEPQRASRWRQPVAAVALSRVSCGAGGFQDYLGLHADPADGRTRELYGREAELTLAIAIFAPRDGGGSACQEAAEAVAESLIRRGAAGLPALEVQTGRVEFLEAEGMYRLDVSCRCTAWLVAEKDEDGQAFADFEVRGRMR